MTSLFLDGNFLDGNIPSFDGLVLLSTLYVGDANLHGVLPSFLNNPYLNDVWIFATYIEGTIPLYSHLSLLQHLDVGYNNIQGTIREPSSSLISLFVHGNFLEGDIPELHIPTLLYFDASDNNLEGGLPSFSNTSQLMFLSASQNFLESCEGLSSLPHLHVLILFGNDISHGVPDLLKFPSLQLLDLYQNSMSGHISNLDSDSLLRFDLGNNYFSGTLPEKIRLPRVQLFDISYNSLSGSIPPTLGAQYSIQLLTLAGNQLSGLVPKVVWRLPNLKLVDLSSNYFSGDLGIFLSPSDENDIFETARYIILILHSNFLTGCLDSSIFDYTSQVIQISLAGNYISCLGDLRYPAKWLTLDLNDNPIEGFVPDSWVNFILLISFGVQRSQMQGDSPRFLPSWMNYSEPYHLIGDDENFICPSVWSVHHPGYSSMDLEPFYYKHVYCKCLPGFYGYGNVCLRCPRDCTCSDGISVQDCFITPNITHAEKILLCPVMGSCEQNLPDDRELVLLGEHPSSCKKGYSDRLCSRCDVGYGAQGYRCEACNSISTTLLLIGLSVGFIGFIVYLARHRGSSSGKMKIIVFHGQIISIISVVLRKSRDIQQATSFSFSLGSFFLPSVSCLFGTNDAFTPLLFNMFRPLLLSIICSILYLVTSKEARDKVVYVWIVLLHMMYYGIARDVFGVYGCTLYDDGTDTWYLNSYSWIACSPQSPEYKKMLALVTVVLFAYIIPFPYFVFKQIKSCIQDESSTSKKIRYGFLYSTFRPDRSMWELISIARRLVFAVVVSIVPYDVPSILFVFLFLTIQFSIWLQHQYHPYRTRGENWMEIISLYVIFFSFFLSLLSTLMSGQSWIHTTIMVSNIAMLSVFFIITLKGFLWKSNPTAMDTVSTYQFPAEDSPTARQVQVVEMNLRTEAEG
eukprot:TRINITY_DN3116_c0_g1_i7.p1 TRINITY_DN3116_c0_g1~~TRINITY_DN3116_c0_g1_i7.p1  ORF type:complete len:912 (+),score=124.87 TRINITY_DN3116_c0_g1_i7:1214-3949(+)